MLLCDGHFRAAMPFGTASNCQQLEFIALAEPIGHILQMDGTDNHVFWFGLPHSAWLVMLSVAIAICGGYVGLGLAA